MAANDYGTYIASALNVVASLYVGYRSRRSRKADAERARKLKEAEDARERKARDELLWKKKTDKQLEELRGIMRRLEYPIRKNFDVDIRLDR